MAFFADTQETAERFGKYITEFQELFRTNDVGFGSPEEFFRLAPRLARDESFREGLTALTRSVQRQEEGRLSLTEMLTVVAIASGGDGIETVGDAGTVPVSLLAVFLAGIGGWSGGEQEEAAVKDATGALSGKDGEVGGQAGDEQAAAELQQRLTAGPEEDIGKLTTTLFGGPSQVKEALGRLEMNTLQMKMHLDSIDSRMERIEPHLDELKTRTAASPERTQQEEPLTVPTPPIKPWPKPEEEAPRPEWMASAPPMKPWPEEKEQDLAWAGSAETCPPPVRTNRTVKETQPVWREPLREPLRDSGQRGDSGARGEIPSRGRTLAEGAASLRAANAEMERDDDEDLPIRVPFDEYLYADEESRWGRRLAGALAVVVIVLVISGAMFYRSHGWHGYNDAVHTVGAALANKKAAVAEWFTSQRGQTATAISSNAPSSTGSAAPSPASSSSQASEGAATGTTPPASGTPASGGIAEREAPDALPAAQTAPVETAASTPPASGAAAHATQSQAATAQTSASTPGAAQARGATAKDDQATVGSAERGRERPARPGMRGVVAVMAGSGAAPEDMSATNLKHGYHSTVPVFVDVARLSAVSDPRPEYPHSALTRGITGEVVVQANIGRNGDVESAQIVSGPAGLLKPSLDAVRQWRFRPYMVKGEPVEARTYVRFRYATER